MDKNDRAVSLNAVITEIGRWLGCLDEDMITRIQTGIKRLPSVSQNIPEHYDSHDLIHRETARRIINSPRSKEQMLAVLASAENQAKTGHWIEEIDDYGKVIEWHCDKCYEDSGFTTDCKWNFCPNCGADMREDVKNDIH